MAGTVSPRLSGGSLPDDTISVNFLTKTQRRRQKDSTLTRVNKKVRDSAGIFQVVSPPD
jgi:hypothetical protein